MQKPLQACAAPHSLACSFLLVATPLFARHIVPIQSWLLRRIGPYWVCDAAVARSTTFTLRRKQRDACMPATLSIYACVAVHVPVASRDDTLDCWEIASARVEPSPDTLKGCHKIYA